MEGRRPSCDQCLVRNILLADHFKEGLVSHKAFRDKHPEGISLTETRNEIKGLDDLDDYLAVVSENMSRRLGAAVMDLDQARGVGLTWRPDPHDEHRFGHLHVLGPKPADMLPELRRECARLANITRWSRGSAEWA